jgi:H+-translocating NAD(P) transhydrogenase subunit alpha
VIETTVLASSAASAGSTSMPFLIIGLWVLLLAVFVGFEVIQKVPPTLHTPLMSGSNAISGITIVGSLYCVSEDFPTAGAILGVLAIAMAMVNVVGGFVVTNRMLEMFRPKSGGAAKPKGGAGDKA